MKRINLMLILVVFLGIFSITANAKDIYVQSTKAEAFFEKRDNYGDLESCIETNISVILEQKGWEIISIGTQTPTNNIIVNFSKVDKCNGQQLINAIGIASLNPSDPNEYFMSKDLSQAFVNKTVLMLNRLGGANFDILVNILWLDRANSSIDFGSGITNVPGINLNSFSEMSRPAAVGGSVIVFEEDYFVYMQQGRSVLSNNYFFERQ